MHDKMKYDRRIKLNIFPANTTYKDDYRPYSPQKRTKHKWAKSRTEPQPKPIPEYYEQDLETFHPFRKEKHVPFNLLWIPRPIVETDPRAKFAKDLKDEEDVDKEEVMKTRPRLIMSPSISVDDIKDKKMRDLVVSNTYKSEWRKAQEEVVKYFERKKRDVFDSVVVPNSSVELSIDLFPPLDQEWRSVSRKWDTKQKRATVDPTKEFWLKQELIPREEGSPFAKLVPPEVKEQIAKLIFDDKLRQPHDKLNPGFAGYQPKLSKGVTLPKTEFPLTHPSLSFQQTYAKRRGE